MNCPKCNQPVEPGAAFCGNCGQPLQANSAPPATPTVSPPQPAQQAQPVQPQQSAPVVSAPSITSQNTPQPAQNGSPVAQVMANQATAPAAPTPNFNSPVVGTVGAGTNVPAYAMPNTAAAGHSGETRAIVGLVVGVIGIPAALLPIIGLILGITGVVLGTTARAKYKHLVSLLAIIFSTLAILASLGIWVYNVQRIEQARGGVGSSDTSSSGSFKAVSTPCYDVKIDGGLNNYQPSGCSFDSASADKEYTVQAMVKPEVTASNLSQYGPTAMQAGAQAVNGTVDSGKLGQFAGSPAYIANISAANNQHGIFALVLHQSANQQNVFLVAHVSKSLSLIHI